MDPQSINAFLFDQGDIEGYIRSEVIYTLKEDDEDEDIQITDVLEYFDDQEEGLIPILDQDTSIYHELVKGNPGVHTIYVYVAREMIGN